MVIGLLLVVGVGSYVLLQFRDVVVTGVEIRDRLQPAATKADELVLARTEAGGYLADVALRPTDELLTELSSSVERATILLSDIDAVTTGEGLDALIRNATIAEEAWLAIDVVPVLTALGEGDRREARRITESAAAWQAYRSYIGSAQFLRTAIDEQREARTERLTEFTRQLSIALAVAGFISLIALIVLWWALRAWIIDPLQHLSDQLKTTAVRGNHESPITPDGPPEITAVGLDAESLRRQLVEEIDEAQAAREALDQDAPLVVAVREELRMRADHTLSGFAIHGQLQPAEGVLAGDWWDCIPLPNGSTGIVIADVSGHGAEAGVTALRIRTLLRQDLIEGNSPSHALAEAAESLVDDDAFVTAIVLVLSADGVVEWANAGHHAAHVVRGGIEHALLPPTGPLLSALGGQWRDEQVTCATGDLLIMFTDGLIESRDDVGTELGDSWVGRFTSDNADLPLAELSTRLLADARNRSANWRRDDVTLVTIRRL